MKQETLEEVAENYFNNFTKRKEEFAFIDGAKWQQEQDNKEAKILENILDDNYDLNVQFHKIKRECIYSFVTAMYNEKLTFEEWEKKHYGNYVEQPKWQQEQDKKMYSEKEVKNLFNQYKEKFSFYRNIQILPSVFDEWFEQFKKK
jgi:hypothetical protein